MADLLPEAGRRRLLSRAARNELTALLFCTLAIASYGLFSSLSSAPRSSVAPSPISAAPIGAHFDHVVIIAMENSAYSSVLGSGTITSCPASSAPFLCSMLPVSSTIPSMNNYGATSADANDFNGCSAACYVGLLAGYTYGVSDGYSCCMAGKLIVNSLQSAGLTWQAYCAEGCPRGNDHFPFTAFSSTSTSSNVFTGSSVTTASLVAAANSASPPNFLWYTPTDSENMHDVSVSTGDSYLKSFLVGSGSIASPASGSLLSSSLFTNPTYHTLLYLWWDECGGSNGSCDSNNDAPNLLFGPTVKKGYVSPDTTGIDEYASIWTIENNWGLTTLAQGDTAAKNAGYNFNDIFTPAGPLPLSGSFTYLPTSPIASSLVSFTAVASGGTGPYAYSWSFGDGSTGTGLTTTHTYTASGSYPVTLSVADSAGGSVKSVQTLHVSALSALTASFTYNPSQPTSGQLVTFTGTGSGGTSPYQYTWNLGGTSKTGNPVPQAFANGTYTVSLTVTDSAGKTATRSESLSVSSTSGGSVPTLNGWGGVRMDESVAGTSGAASSVFPGEYASNMELLLIQLKEMGYNTVRVEFDPYCTDSVDFNSMSVYSQTNAQRSVEIAQHYGFWVIIDYHGFSDIFRNTSCWLSYWKPIVQKIGPLYSQIIWEPENEPTLDCTNSPSSCPTAPCSDDASCVTYLSSAYQEWINQTRSLGNTNWIVVQNLCSYACSFSYMSQGYPTVTDPLGTLSQGGRIFVSLHSYMDYGSYSGQWTNATADSLAQQYYQAVLSGVSNTGWPALNTEGGTDPLCPASCAPDTVLTGSAGYTVVTFHFIQALVNLYNSNGPQRINWVWWPAGSWTNTPGAGLFGAVQCTSNLVGWGCLLQTVPVMTNSSFAIWTSTKSVSIMQTFSENVTITLASLSGFAGSVDLRTTVNGTGVTATLGGQSQYLSSGSDLSITLNITTSKSTSLGNYTVTITASNGPLSQLLTIPLRVNMLGDLDGDGTVNIVDLASIAACYLTTPASPNWNPLADLNHDGVVNMADVAIAAASFS